MTDAEWLALLHGDQPDQADQLRATRAVLMDRITAIDDLLAKLEQGPPTIHITMIPSPPPPDDLPPGVAWA